MLYFLLMYTTSPMRKPLFPARAVSKLTLTCIGQKRKKEKKKKKNAPVTSRSGNLIGLSKAKVSQINVSTILPGDSIISSYIFPPG